MPTVWHVPMTPHIVNLVRTIFIYTQEIIHVWVHVHWDFMRSQWQNHAWHALQVAHHVLTRHIVLHVFRMWLLWPQRILVLLLVHRDIMVISLLRHVKSVHLNAWHANQPQPTALAAQQDITSSNYPTL